MCIRMGGTISGEHGVGIEKRPMMRELFAPEDLATMERLRAAFDPERRLNPGKILPGDGDGRGIDDAHAAPAQLGGMRPGSGEVEGAWI
jgi:glycolate oxidase